MRSTTRRFADMARVGVEPTDHQGLSLAALPVCVPCRHFHRHSAPPMGFEPTISTLTGWRALRAAPRGRFDSRMAQEGFEPSASLVLSESGLPVAYRADVCIDRTQGGIEPTGTRFKPGRSTVGVPGPEAEAVGLEPTSGLRRHLFSRQAPDPAGWLPTITPVPGAGIEPAASTFRAWRHYQQQLPRSSGRRIRTSTA